MSPRHSLVLFLILSAVIASSVSAEETLDPGKGLVLSVAAASSAENGGSESRDGSGPRSELSPFLSAAVSAALRAFSSEGLGVSASDSAIGSSEPDAAAAAARARSCRWAITVMVDLDGRQLSWRFCAYDARDGALRASDGYTAFAGLTALPLLDESARKAAAAWAAAVAVVPPPLPVPYRLTLRGSPDGAAVAVSQEGGISLDAGELSGGILWAEYVPLREGVPFTAEISRDGYWPREKTYPKGPTEKPMRLPPLYRKTMNAVVPSIGLGRLLGGAVGYRRYVSPDAAYFRVENIAWVAADFQPGSEPVYHDEIRIGAAVYPITNRSGVFRVSVGSGFSGILTYNSGVADSARSAGFDATADILWFTLELHRPEWAFVVEERFPYSLGLSSGFLPAGWCSLGNSGPLFLSAGVMFKW